MKLKSRVMRQSIWRQSISGNRRERISTKHRRPPMPQFDSTLPAEKAADAAFLRCTIFKFLNRLKKLPKKQMSYATLQQLGLVD